jgi:hypothetical protein
MVLARQESLDARPGGEAAAGSLLIERSLALVLPLVFCAAALSALPLYSYLKYGILTFEDDAYYYFVIARNIHDLGLSTFDHQTLTNGYQPLWLLLLLGEYALCHSFDGTQILELLLLAGALAFLLGALRSKDPAKIAALSFGFVVSVAGFTVNGMESSLLVFCLSALFWALERLDARTPRSAIAIGCLGALAIGARIDSAVFVLPLIAVALPSARSRLAALGAIGILGAVYLLANLVLFGAALPVSGEVKSLGGAQFNRHLFEDFGAQIFEPGAVASLQCAIDSSCGNSDYVRIVLLIPAAALLLIFGRPSGLARAVLLTFLIGIAAYAAKLFFFSSWSIWPWYFFPVFIGFYGALRSLFQIADRAARRPSAMVLNAALASLLFALIAIPAGSYLADPPGYDWEGFAVINRRAVARFGAVLGHARIAMGDRAGSFAFAYDGPVTQLEGLVEDPSYLKLIAEDGDLKAQLCRRGVRYIAAYADKLGNYSTYRFGALRSWLTSFQGPSLTVRKADEVGHVFDLNVFDSKDLGDEGDSYLYIWRLSGCPSGASRIALSAR